MSSMPWFRVYSEMLDDPKIKRITKKTGQSKALIIGVWICLLSLANKSTERGKLLITEDMPYSIEDLEDETGIPQEIIAQLLDEFRMMGMIIGNNTLEVANWSKRQYKSDNVAERVRRFREKQKDETLQERSSIVIDTDSESDKDIDIEKEEDKDSAAPAAKSPPIIPLTDGQRFFLDQFKAKRFKTPAQKDAVQALEKRFGTAKFKEGTLWAAKRGMTMGDAVISLETALQNWGEPKKQKAEKEVNYVGGKFSDLINH